MVFKTLLLRKALFYLFTVVYCLLCPLIILYALGYLLRPGMEKGIVKTGLISLSSMPAGASVYLEKRHYSQKTPAIIRDLLPAGYAVTVFLKDHKAWSRNISVEAEKASVFEKILLLPNDWTGQKLLGDEFQNLIPLPGSRFFILTKGPDLEDMALYDRKNKKLEPVIPEDFPFKGARVLSYFLADQSERFLLDVQTSFWGEEKFLWIEPAASAVRVQDVTPLFPDKPRAVDWDFHKPQLHFVFKNGVIHKLNIDSGAVYPRLMENTLGYGLFDKKVYAVNQEGVLQKMDVDAKIAETLDQDPVLKDFLVASKDLFRVKVLPGERILFWGRRGELFANWAPFELVEKGVVGVQSDPRVKKSLVWRGDQLGVLDCKGESARVHWVFAQGKKISQAFWVYGDSHILFRDDDRLYLMELGNNMEPVIDTLFQVKGGSSVIYEEESGLLYYLEKATGNLCSCALIPQKESAHEV